MTDPTLIEEVLDAWQRDQEHPLRDRTKRPIPSVQSVRNFIDVAFFASLKQEEGRVVRFSAVLVSESEVRDASNRARTNILAFDEPIPFTPPSVAKIAPAFDPDLTSVAISTLENRDGLWCWGLLSYGQPANIYTKLPVGPEGAGYFRPDYFTVSTRSPGSLLFSRGSSMIGRLIDGHFVSATPGPFIHASFGKYWKRLVDNSQTWAKSDGSSDWFLARNSLEILLNEAARRGHGATIIVVDPRYCESATPFYTARHRVTGEQLLSPRVKRCIENPTDCGDFAMWIGRRQLAFESIQRAAQLSAIDGALVLNSDFEILAFGAKLSAPAWGGQIVIGPDESGILPGQVFDKSRYGTRHGSAINFAGSCPNSLAFVISQDGPIRAFVRDNNTVFCWLDCTVSMDI